MEKIGFYNTAVTGGFWKKKQVLVRKVTVNSVYDRFKETGRIDAFKCDWKPGMPNQPHYFWDSDVAKWIEGAAYLIAEKRDAKLEKKIDSIVSEIEKNQCGDGYFNIYFQVVEPDKRFFCRDWHELYCAGHLIEAAVAYFNATGKDTLLSCMEKYVDYIDLRFRINRDTPFTTPGHEEIELALVKLYDLSHNRKYLDLAEFFINARGTVEEYNAPWMNRKYNQSHLPVRSQTSAEGHSVRAVYLYCGMADVAARTGDSELKSACEAVFDDITGKKIYISGGIGSSSGGEAFTVPFDLPNLLAYTETCAALGLALFANRMLQFGADSKYSDCVERIIYNGFMSSLSLDGKSFFYENPLEVIPYLPERDVSVTSPSVHWPQNTRSEVFSCSCCPPNIVRFIPSIADMLYSNDGDTVYVHQYMNSRTKLYRNGKQLTLTQTTRYPESGKIKFKVIGGDLKIAFRIPWWCEKEFCEYTINNGYASVTLSDGIEYTVDFGMPVNFVEAKPEVLFDCNRYAIMRGPVLYCMEGVDNGNMLRDIIIDSHSKFVCGKNNALGVPTLTVRAYKRRSQEDSPLYCLKKSQYEKTSAVLIPYYAFANRGKSAMQVWHSVK